MIEKNFYCVGMLFRVKEGVTITTNNGSTITHKDVFRVIDTSRSVEVSVKVNGKRYLVDKIFKTDFHKLYTTGSIFLT